MFSKFFALAAVALTFTVQVQAHAAISPELGVTGTPKRANVQRPSAASPCGKTSIAANIDTSTPVAAAADGTFTVTATNFNAGRDGSRQVTMTVDAAGTGQNFVAGQVTKNGVAAPTSVGSDQIVAALPAGTKCTGGKAGNLCLASFKTLGNFGNCVVVSQGAGTAGAAAGNSTTAATSNSTSTTGTTSNTTTTDTTTGTAGNTTAGTTTGSTTAATGNNTQTGKTGKGQAVKQAIQNKIGALKAAFNNVGGTRAPRAVRAREAALREFELVN